MAKKNKNDSAFRRVNVLISEQHYRRIHESNLNLSGLLRDLLSDRFSEKKVVLSVSDATRMLYDRAVSNFGLSDADLERCLRSALDEVLQAKSREIESLRKGIRSRR